jgi:putative protease
MAPAGSWASLAAALKSGANSIYFGVGKINMRARAANNFEPNDLREVVAKSRKFGARAYLTLNTLLFDEELAEAQTLCRQAKAAGVDAVIAADPAVLQIARAEGLPVHLSVQANVTNLAAVQFYAAYADVIVLARELSLDQIRGIIVGIRERSITGPSGQLVKIEIFAHGALCVALSGKCQMSLSVYGPKASANRGACFQPCRRNYRVTDTETGTELVLDGHQVMSPKDLCTLPFLDQILGAGVSVLKLEGRGRAADYVATVVRVYREAIAAWQDGSFATRRDTGVWIKELDSVFNRGFWQGGYYLGKPLGEWTASSQPASTEKKVFVGKITKYYARSGVAEVLLNASPLSVGDQVWVLGETTGALRLPVTELRIGDPAATVLRAEPGATAAFPVATKLRPGDQVYRIAPSG